LSYELSDNEFYSWPEATTWAATSVVRYIAGPRGKVGLVRDLIVEVTTSMVGTTTVPELQLGISSGDFTYGRFRLGTATATGYNTGVWRASQQLIVGNPPRTFADFAGHVVLDGGPLTSKGISGGSYGTVVPQGRIPSVGGGNGAGVVTNIIQGVDSSHSRIFLNGSQPVKDLVVGQLVNVFGSAGATSVNANAQAITALDTTNYQYFEVAQTFSTAWTSGGFVVPLVVLTMQANGAGSGAGGGIARVKIQWLGSEND
jgi:hypothetical protein